jgi:EAL domain-containing protein (putative c-di-GMP-specific phosphodiesterase class I)
MSVVAEGVEEEETLQQLAELGCELVQGYHLSRPLSAADAHAFLAVSLTGDIPQKPDRAWMGA